MAEQTVIRLKRRETSTPWGFRMQGGREFGNCLYIQKVTSKSVAAKCGLLPGDGILMIGNTPANYMSHEQAKMEIIRAGNELDLVVQRNAMDVGQDEVDTASSSGTRSQVSEEASEYRGYTNPSVQSRSFKILQASLNYSEASGASACQPVESYLFRYQDMYAPLIDKYKEAEEDERDRKTTMLQNTIRQERGRSGQTREVTRLDGGSGILDAPGHPENRTELIRNMVDMERSYVEDKLNMLRKISKNNSRSFSPEKPRTISPETTLSLRQDVADNGPTQFIQDVLQTERMGVEEDGYVSLDLGTLCLPETSLRDEKNVMVDNRSAQVHQNVTQLQEIVNGNYMRQELGPVVQAPTAQLSCFEADLAQTEVKAFQATARPDAFRPSQVQPVARQVEAQQSQASEAEQSLTSKVIQFQTQEILSDTEKSKAGSTSIQYQTSEVEQTYNSANTMLLESKTAKVETKMAQTEMKSTVVESAATDSMIQRTPNENVVKPVDADMFVGGREVRENRNAETETSVERQTTEQVASIDVKVDDSTMNVEAVATKKATEIIESAKFAIRAETKRSETKQTEPLNPQASGSENEMFKMDSAEAEVALEFVTNNRERINKPEAEQGQVETNETRCDVLQNSVNPETYIIKSERMTSILETKTAKSAAERAKSINEETKTDNKTVWLETEAAKSETWAVHNETEAAKSGNWAVQDETDIANSVTWEVQDETESANSATWAVQDETATANSATWALQNETEIANLATWAVQDETATANSATLAVQDETEAAKSETWAVHDETGTANLATWAVQDENETAHSVTWAVQDETETANSITWAVQDRTETLKADTENKLIIDAGKSEIEREMNYTVTEGKHTTSIYGIDGVKEVLENVKIKTEIAVADNARIERSKILARKTEIVREFSYDEDDDSYETWTEEESDNDVDSIVEETISKELETTGEETLKMETS